MVNMHHFALSTLALLASLAPHVGRTSVPEEPSLVGDTPDRTELARKVESFINSCDSLKVEVEVQHAKDPIVRGVS